MGIRVLEATSAPEGMETLVRRDPRAGLYQHPRWIAALRSAYPRLRPRYLILEEDGTVTAATPLVIIRRFGLREVVSMPFGTHGGPVVTPDASKEGLDRLNARFMEYLGGPGTYRFEMSVYDPPDRLLRSLDAGLGSHLIPTTTFVLDLTPGGEGLWKGYQQQLRRSVRVATRSGVTVREERGPGALPAFYPLYAGQSRRWSLTWRHSRSALATVAAALGEDFRVWVASRNGEDIAAQLGLYHDGKAVYLWLSGATRESRPVYAFHAVLHHLFRDAAERGFTTCHLGASMDISGIENFKGSFGAEGRPLHRYYHQAGWRRWVQKAWWGRPERRP